MGIGQITQGGLSFFGVFVSGSKVAESLNFTGKVIQHNIVLWVPEDKPKKQLWREKKWRLQKAL